MRSVGSGFALVLLSFGCGLPLLSGQEVVSVAPSAKAASTSTSFVNVDRPGVYIRRNQPLIHAVADAYSTDEFHIIAPDWLRVARYDFAIDPGRGDPVAILRQVLEKRFALNLAWEVRPVETWVLERGENGRPLNVSSDPERASAMLSSSSFKGTTTIASMAMLLSRMLGTAVVDESGIGGVFSFSIEWTPNDVNSIVQAFFDAGLDLHREYRDTKVLVVYSGYWPDAPQGPAYGCEPNGELKAVLNGLTPVEDTRISFPEKLAERERLIGEYPENIFAEMAIQDLIRDDPTLSKDRAAALARYRKMVDRLAGGLLEARLLAKKEVGHSRALVHDVLRGRPTFAWAHLLSAELAQNPQDLENELRRFREFCPASTADAPLYRHVRSPELLRSISETFSKLLSGRSEDDALRAFPEYWQMRTRAGPFWPPNWLLLEVARLRQLNRFDNGIWISTVTRGYELIGDVRSLEIFSQALNSHLHHQ